MSSFGITSVINTGDARRREREDGHRALLAYMTFPPPHRTKLHSNPFKTESVGIFSN